VERMAPYIADFAVDSAVVLTHAVDFVSAHAVSQAITAMGSF